MKPDSQHHSLDMRARSLAADHMKVDRTVAPVVLVLRNRDMWVAETAAAAVVALHTRHHMVPALASTEVLHLAVHLRLSRIDMLHLRTSGPFSVGRQLARVLLREEEEVLFPEDHCHIAGRHTHSRVVEPWCPGKGHAVRDDGSRNSLISQEQSNECRSRLESFACQGEQ